MVLVASSIVAAAAPNNFFGNYLNKPEYYLPVYPVPSDQLGGDLNAGYYQFYVPTNDNYELLVVGEYPRARYFALTAYDDHGLIVDTLYDAQIVPLKAGDSNPYAPGGVPQEDVLYAVRVRLGPKLADDDPQAPPAAGCGLDGYNVSNVLDGRYHHTHYARYSAAQSGFTVTGTGPGGSSVTVTHDDDENNKGVQFLLRTFLLENDVSKGVFDLRAPLVFLRKSSDGCPLNLAQLTGKPAPIKATDWYTFNTTTNKAQIAGHTQNENNTPVQTPFGIEPNNGVTWIGSSEYILNSNPDTGYVSATVPSNFTPQKLNQQGRVMRMRFKLAQVPSGPQGHCRSCPLTGSEQLRYWGMSFVQGSGGSVFASLSDMDLNPDATGLVNLIIAFGGTPIPASVLATSAIPGSGVSVVNLPLPTQEARIMTIRNLLPSADFRCTVDNVPHKTNEWTDSGGYMGNYAPYVDYPVAATQLPTEARPRPGNLTDTCNS